MDDAGPIDASTSMDAPGSDTGSDTGIDASGTLAAGRVGANQIKAAPHRWRWREIGPYLDRIADIAKNSDVSPIEFAEPCRIFTEVTPPPAY